MSYLPAKRLGINNRGLLKENYFADIVIFNPDEVQDNATYSDPKQYSSGFNKIIVNGKIVLDNGIHTEVFSGKVLKRL